MPPSAVSGSDRSLKGPRADESMRSILPISQQSLQKFPPRQRCCACYRGSKSGGKRGGAGGRKADINNGISSMEACNLSKVCSGVARMVR